MRATPSTSTWISTPAWVYFLNGIAEDLFVPVFAVGRVPGWTVQVMEQLENNILIRPLTHYTGPEARDYVPVENR